MTITNRTYSLYDCSRYRKTRNSNTFKPCYNLTISFQNPQFPCHVTFLSIPTSSSVYDNTTSMEIYVFDDHCSLKDDRFKYDVVTVVFMFIGIAASAYCIFAPCFFAIFQDCKCTLGEYYDSHNLRARKLAAQKMQLDISTPTNTNRSVPESNIHVVQIKPQVDTKDTRDKHFSNIAL
jgi:hypothetical protein